jgi:hypothetical protein
MDAGAPVGSLLGERELKPRRPPALAYAQVGLAQAPGCESHASLWQGSRFGHEV